MTLILYHICPIKVLREKDFTTSWSKIFALWAFCKNLTHAENMEEYEEIGTFWPEQLDYTADMAHVSH